MSSEEDSVERPPSPETPTNFRLAELSSRSRELLETLARERGRASHFYEGALRTLADRTNPVRVAMAAYALRELIEELERVATTPKRGPKLGDNVNALRERWKKAERKSDDGGLQDHCDPAVFAVDQFFADIDRGHQNRRDRAQTTIAELDPVRRDGPPEVREMRTEALLDFRSEFNEVLHGNRQLGAADFESRVERFEGFLLEWFRPRTFADFDAIDVLLEEGPPT